MTKFLGIVQPRERALPKILGIVWLFSIFAYVLGHKLFFDSFLDASWLGVDDA